MMGLDCQGAASATASRARPTPQPADCHARAACSPPHSADDWASRLASPPRAGHAAHRWLRQTATVVADLDPFLRSWSQALAGPPGPAAVHLAVVLVQSDLRPDFPTTVAALFDTADAAHRFGDWLAAPDTLDHLRRAAGDLTATPDARRLDLAVDRLTRYRAARARTA